jgi:hypothetical protein
MRAQGASMDLVTRAKNITLTPGTEWPVIEGESATTVELLTGYALPLAAIGAVAGFIGSSLIGLPFLGRTPFISGIVAAVFGLVMTLVSCFVLSLIIDALAPTFNGQKNQIQALKLAVYSFTPAWIAGVLRIVPLLSILIFFASLYAIYVLYTGIPRLMKSPQDKALPYTAVVVVCAIVLGFVVAAITGILIGGAMLTGGALSASNSSSSSSTVQYDKNSTMGKLQEMAKAAEASSKKMDAAAKSGDANAQANAAMEGLGALLGGGKRVDPVDIEQLKPLVPDTLGGMPKASSRAEKSGIGGLMVSKAEARYADGDKQMTLEVSDTGGVSGLLALAGWAQGVSEDDNGSERTEKVDGRLTHQKVSKTGGTNEYAIVIADRFVVSAKGHGVDINALKSAVASIDLAKLESMKNIGVKQ